MKKKPILFLFLLLTTLIVQSQEIVYKPINPSFLGGNSFNANWLLSQATAQNKYKEKTADNNQKSDLEKFTESLNRQLLNQISRNLFDSQFGEGGIQEGSFTFGSLVVDVSQTADGMQFNIFDTNTGEQTSIIIPNY
ncbi:MAG TPA: curli assembly protein CsgF [Flavobacteriia bacterium]|nr:curli assembly protein CsgF [Flavobacteriia bacterium]